MPPFILEPYKHPLGRPAPKIIPTKNEYCAKVKMPDWDRLAESEPKDNDPYNPPGGNQFLPTYNRIGHMTEDEDHFKSVTQLLLEQIQDKDKYFMKSEAKPLIHYLTMTDKCEPPEPNMCPVSNKCANDYRTTMQRSYKIPCRTVLRQLAIPKIPFLQNRKLLWENPVTDENKFYDDCYVAKIQTLQKIKGWRCISYNPMTQKYTDGSSPKTRQRKCQEVPYRHVK